MGAGGAVSTPGVERYAWKRDEMAAINQPAGPALTVRDAAAACRLSPRTIRRKLTAGSLPERVQDRARTTPNAKGSG